MKLFILVLMSAGLFLGPRLYAAERPPKSVRRAEGVSASSQERMSPAQRRSLKRSLKELKRALMERPEDAELWRRLGFAYQALGRVDKAREAFEKLVELSPEDAAGYYMLALVYEKLGETDKAVEAWKKCLEYAEDGDLRDTAKKHLKHLGAR